MDYNGKRIESVSYPKRNILILFSSFFHPFFWLIVAAIFVAVWTVAETGVYTVDTFFHESHRWQQK